MALAERSALSISAIFDLGESARATANLAILRDEDRFLRREREPVCGFSPALCEPLRCVRI